MAKLKIKNFGPITQGFTEDDGFMEITPVTVVCGEQASGKSSVAKLYAYFSWLEKAFARMDYTIPSFTTEEFIELSKNQQIQEYFRDETYLEYQGTLFSFIYSDKTIKYSSRIDSITKETPDYYRPKIMYISSERNILSTLEDVENVRKVPVMLSLLLDEYKKAKKASATGVFTLPVSNIELKYDKNTENTYVLKGDSVVNILNASSGIQSVAPMSVVSRYLSETTLAESKKDLQNLSYTERRFIRDWIAHNTNMPEQMIETFDKAILQNTDELIKSIPSFAKYLNYYFNRCFINIVEEPEQNLYPTSQEKVLYELLECANVSPLNSLFVTTHSPYIISYLTLAIKAAELKNKNCPVEKLAEIVPEKAMVEGKNCTVFEIKDGTINKLKTYGAGLPSDSNYLNNLLEETNKKFDRLLDLQEEYE